MSEGGADDEGGATRRSSRFPKRGRVTLKWQAAPLALPGEDAAPPEDDASGELLLPPIDDDEGVRPASIPPPGELPIGVDGWERQMPASPSAPLPSRAPTQPPLGAASTAGSEPLDGGALALVDKRSRPSRPTIDIAAEMRDRYALGDYTAALRSAELILGSQPEHAEARTISAECRERLAQLYTSRLGSLARVPEVAIDAADVRWLGLDHRAGFLLSRIDGEHAVEQLVDVSGMPRLEALKTLVELLDVGAIRLGTGPG